MKTFIVVRTQCEGVHRYKDAPDEVRYLKDYHRHIFHIETKIEVFHEDRELEFIMVKHAINNYLQEKIYESGIYCFENDSCETIAIQLIKFLKEKYGERKITVSVFEDNENGAIVEEN